MAFDPQKYVEELKAKKASQPVEYEDNGPRLNKVWMVAEENRGTLTGVLLPDPTTGQFFTYFDKDTGRIREVKYYDDDRDNWAWGKIMPKEFYGQLTSEQSAKYDQVVSIVDSLMENETLGDTGYLHVKYKSYALYNLKITSHFNTKNEVVKNGDVANAGRMSFIVVPTGMLSLRQREAIEKLSSAAGGDVSWLALVQNSELTGRTAAFELSFKNSSTGGFGYDVSAEYRFNGQGPFNAVPTDFVITQEEADLTKDGHIKSFLGWQAGENSLFNDAVFDGIMGRLIELSDGKVDILATPAQPVVPSNAVDQVIPQTPQAPAQAHIDPMATPSAPVQPAAVQEVPQGIPPTPPAGPESSGSPLPPPPPPMPGA